MEVVVKGLYRHFKGDLYIVEDIALDCETLATMVVYRALYDNKQLWIRSLESFTSDVDKIKYPDVKQSKRFQLEEIKKTK